MGDDTGTQGWITGFIIGAVMGVAVVNYVIFPALLGETLISILQSL